MEAIKVVVYYTLNTRELSPNVEKKYISKLTPELQIVNHRYRFWKDRNAHLFGKLLLLEGLKEYDKSGKLNLSHLNYSPNGKPYFESDINFNISHSGNYVLCAIGKKINVGVDIEEIKPIQFKDFKNIMSQQQWFLIRNAENSTKRFFDFWVIKESVVKAAGDGLTSGLDKIWIDYSFAEYNNKKWNLNLFQIDENYSSCIATDFFEVAFELKKICF
ncbi:4'-phosphopantetheinyl transferase family protein [Yeosuana marina]|uniref:4'-phosphopantetheinyl transferase family protein n=1 Tax=Yeosuana marina TaxID=1565536 RepID=UPI0030C88744